MRWLLPPLIMLMGTASPGAAQQIPGPWDIRNLAVHGRLQNTTVYDFDGDGIPDILNASIDVDAEPPVRWLALHLQRRPDKDPGSRVNFFEEKPDFLWPLQPTAVALTLGRYVPGTGVNICTIAPDGVYYYPFENGRIVEEPRKLIHARTFFTSPSNRALPIWMYSQDISGDGRDDLVLPTPEGYRVYFQTEPGHFGKISRLETPGSALTPRRFPEALEFVSAFFNLQTQLPRVALADIDGDGRQDLVTIEGNRIRYFFQLEPNEYRMQGKVGKGLYWMKESIVTALEDEVKKDTVGYTGIDFRDIDGDGLPDLVITKIQGEVGLFESLKTRIEICKGGAGHGIYAPDLFISIAGVSIDPAFIDMNGDGKLDCLVSRMRTDLVSQGLQATILQDIAVDYEIFQFEPEQNRYSEGSVYSHEVHMTFEDLKDKAAAWRPIFFVPGDLNGDGRPDQVLVNPKTNTVEMHPGRRSGERIDFDGTAHMEHKLDRFPDGIQFNYFNSDGIVDVMLTYGKTVSVMVTRKR